MLHRSLSPYTTKTLVSWDPGSEAVASTVIAITHTLPTLRDERVNEFLPVCWGVSAIEDAADVVRCGTS